jgi:hypothetical protein
MAVVVPGWRAKPTTRTSLIQETILVELGRMRAAIDAAPDVRSVTITVKMKVGGITPRAVVSQIETEATMAD